MNKPVVLSGSTTTGNLTLGNYIGALGPWIEMIDQHDCYFMVANLHSLTTLQDAKALKERTISFFAQYIALGLDPEKSCIFLQSQVPEHAELNWVLTCQSPLGQLQRMTQYKDKTEHQKDIKAGLLMYPVLMAADILLYRPEYVPVGQDQKQHIELCRDLVDYFNNRFGETFTQPEPLIQKTGAKIMSLADPTKKMSKSDTDGMGAISILDDAKTVEKKLKRAVTDSGTQILYSESNPGIANLMTIYSVLTGKSFPEIETEFTGKMYGHLKMALIEIINQKLAPIQKKHSELMNDQTHLQNLMKKGADKARERASQTLKTVYDRVGML